jgi:hypothetical protein
VNWWQVIVIAGAILFAGVYVGNGIAGLSYGFRDIAQRLESLGTSVAATSGAIHNTGIELFEQLGEAGERWKSLHQSLTDLAESLKILLNKLHDPDAMADSVKSVRDRIRHKDEAEQSRAAWEQERQKQHDAWTRAAREEADRLASKEPGQGETK